MLTFALADIASIGRVDTAMLTQQQMMELFFTPVDYDTAREQLKGNEDDACSWKQVYCDDAKNITKMSWLSTYIRLEGSIDFSMLPTNLENLTMYNQRLVGEIDVRVLPENLEYFGVQMCGFTGTLDLGSLPRTLQSLFVIDNQITGIVNLCNLPEDLKDFLVKDFNVKQPHLHVGILPASTLRIRLERCRIESITYENPDDSQRVVQ